jgi:hypothetical protein
MSRTSQVAWQFAQPLKRVWPGIPNAVLVCAGSRFCFCVLNAEAASDPFLGVEEGQVHGVDGTARPPRNLPAREGKNFHGTKEKSPLLQPWGRRGEPSTMMPGTLESKPNSVWTCARWLDLVGSDATLDLAIRRARSRPCHISSVNAACSSTCCPRGSSPCCAP